MADKWTEIRSLAEQGASYQSLADTYGVEVDTINKRSFRDGWLTPARVKVKIQSLQKLQCPPEDFAPQNTASSEKVGQILTETWQQKADSLRVLSFETAVEAIKRSRGLIAIETASDLKAAVHVARQATGVLDTEAPAISLNLGGSGGFFDQAGPVFEAVSEPVESVTLEGCGV
jgi:hypothetical protein